MSEKQTDAAQVEPIVHSPDGVRLVFSDDAVICNEPWAQERGATVDGCSKRYALCWETDRAHLAFLPRSGHLCAVLSLNHVCVIENPTRRQVRMMLRAIGIVVE